MGLPNSLIGDLIFSVKYCFSGIKSPSVDLVKEGMLAIAAGMNGTQPRPITDKTSDDGKKEIS